MLDVGAAALIVIDVQEKLFRVIHQKEKLADNLQRLIRGIQVLKLPVITTEQYPRGLGPTISEVARLLSTPPIPKLSFSCCGNEDFLKRLKALKRTQLLVAGIESHVCVYQTVADLVNCGYEVHAVTDAVSSRTPENREIGFKLMSRSGGVLTSVEAALFELLRVAGSEEFKAVSSIVK